MNSWKLWRIGRICARPERQHFASATAPKICCGTDDEADNAKSSMDRRACFRNSSVVSVTTRHWRGECPWDRLLFTSVCILQFQAKRLWIIRGFVFICQFRIRTERVQDRMRPNVSACLAHSAVRAFCVASDAFSNVRAGGRPMARESCLCCHVDCCCLSIFCCSLISVACKLFLAVASFSVMWQRDRPDFGFDRHCCWATMSYLEERGKGEAEKKKLQK